MAMFMASRGCIPPKEWHHDPKLRSKSNLTVAHLICLNNPDISLEIYNLDDWIFTYEEGIDYMIEKNNLKLKFFIIPPIGFILKNNEIDKKFNLNVNMYTTYTGYVRDSSKRC